MCRTTITVTSAVFGGMEITETVSNVPVSQAEEVTRKLVKAVNEGIATR